MGPAASTPMANAIVISRATASMRWATRRLAASFRRGIGTRRYEVGGESGWDGPRGIGAYPHGRDPRRARPRVVRVRRAAWAVLGPHRGPASALRRRQGPAAAALPPDRTGRR